MYFKCNPAVPNIDSFNENFVNINNPNNTDTVPSSQRALRPNVSLDETIRLYQPASPSLNRLPLISPSAFQTTTSIAGVYICSASNEYGSRNASANITVKSEIEFKH